jgi:hypothetical protein
MEDIDRMVARTNIKTFAFVLFFLLMATGALAACGGSSSTASTSSDSGSSSASSGASTSSTPAAGNRPNRVSGTITKYDSSAQTVTIIELDSTTATFSISKARIVKSEKITLQQLSSLLSNSGTTVMVQGQQAGTGTYTAQTIVVDNGANGMGPGGGAGQGAMPNGTLPAGAPQGGQMTGTPPAGAPQGQGGQNGNRGVVVRNGKLQNNQLVGSDRQGQTVTVNLSGTTTILQRTVATASDLQTGQKVTIVGAPAQSGSTADARQILIGDSSMM